MKSIIHAVRLIMVEIYEIRLIVLFGVTPTVTATDNWKMGTAPNVKSGSCHRNWSYPDDRGTFDVEYFCQELAGSDTKNGGGKNRPSK